MSKQSMKQGARHSVGDMKLVQSIHDGASSLGADCASMDEGKAIALKMVKTLRADSAKNVKNYAVSESYDIQQAAMVLNGLASLATNEAAQEEAGDVSEIAKLMRGLIEFIGGEIDEMEAAATATDETTEQFAMMSTKHISAPAYIKSLHIPYSEQFFKDVLAVKYVGKNEIQHYTNLWGDPNLVDLDVEYFDRNLSDFWDKHLGFPRPLTWNHAQTRDWKGSVIIGDTVGFKDDNIGRLANSILKEHDEYRKLVDSLIDQRVVGTSSDSAPQYVVREKNIGGKKWTKSGLGNWECKDEIKSHLSGGATLLKQWPLFGSALTHVPCEPRMLDVGSPYWKTAGVNFELLKPRIAEAGLEIPREEMAKRLEQIARRSKALRLHSA